MTGNRTFVTAVPLAGMAVTSVLYLLLSRYSFRDQVLGYEQVTLVTVLGVTAGVIYLALPLTLSRIKQTSTLLTVGLVTGLVARLILFPSDPILENDYFRYLWDGGVLAIGENPYQWAPGDVLAGNAPPPILLLAEQAGGLVEQIGYSDLRTIYPPVAVAAFSLAHLVDAWGLVGLRALYLVADGVTVFILITILRHLDRSPLWVLLYWLNPLAIQTVFNAMHMDMLMLPFLAAGVLFALKRQPLVAAIFMVCAAGVKLWPALLVPVLLAYAAQRRTEFVLSVAVFGVGFVALLLPFLLSGPASSSGLFAFSGEWRKNEVIFGLVVSAMDTVLQFTDTLRFDAERLARLAIAAGLGLIALWPKKASDDYGLIVRLLVLTAGLFVFAPAPYPWYFLWLLPFLVLVPSFALLVWTATLPLYQLRFHPHFIEDQARFESTIVPFEHGIPLVLLAFTMIFRMVKR